MWEYLCLFLFQICSQVLLMRWFGENNHRIIIISFISALFSTVMSYFLQHIILFILCGQLLFTIIGYFCHYAVHILLLDILLSLMTELTLYPLSLFYQSFSQSWEYIFYIFSCIFLLMAFIMNFYENIEKEWLKQMIFFPYQVLLSVFIITFLGLIIECMILYTYQYTSVIKNMIIVIVCLIIPLITYFLDKLIITYTKMKQSEEMFHTWQKESRDYMNVIRSQRHDFNFHLHAIVGLIENEEYDECQNYISQMVNSASSINDIMPVHDAVTGSMLYNMRKEALLKGINIDYEITYDMKDILCNAFECNKIIGNLIQNAIDAIHLDEEKRYGIKVSILKRRGNTVIIVENLFMGDKDVILHAFDLGYSTKKHHEGIGLAMIARTIEKYDGRIYTELEDDIVRFIVNIPNRVSFEG